MVVRHGILGPIPETTLALARNHYLNNRFGKWTGVADESMEVEFNSKGGQV